MTQDVVDFDRIREQFMAHDFPIVPALQVTEEAHLRWAETRGQWIDTMLNPTAASGFEVEFYPDQVDATSNAFDQSMAIQALCLGLERDQQTEQTAFDNAWGNYFPDELYVDIRKLPQVFQALVVEPSVLVRNYQLAMNRVQPASGTAT